MSAVSDYTDWKRKRLDIGCQFARLIATTPDRYGQRLDVVQASSSPGRIAASIAKSVQRAIDDPSAAAAVILLPKVTELKQLADGIIALGSNDDWEVKARTFDHPTEGRLVAICASRMIPSGMAVMPSEALVLGPFDVFPPTRRSPVVGLEVFVGVPRQLDPKTSQPPTKANLAHMDVFLPTHDAFERMWGLSVKGRLQSLGGVDDQRAKAKVSLVFPDGLTDYAAVAA